jgi:hypothetical protein
MLLWLLRGVTLIFQAGAVRALRGNPYYHAVSRDGLAALSSGWARRQTKYDAHGLMRFASLSQRLYEASANRSAGVSPLEKVAASKMMDRVSRWILVI